ncbi:MAG: hypothetical protein NC131_11375 [Roseburia sp.]|nr:hypothetical protein [Roseburia sp.]
MITYQEIVANIDKEKHIYGDITKKYEEDWEPVRCVKYTLPDFKAPVYSNAKGAKGKWAKQLSKIYAFIRSVQHKRYNEGCTIMPISSRNSTNRAIWGSHVSVSANIKVMLQIGLLDYETKRCRFNSSDNECYTYRYYVENEVKFIQLCKDNNIEPYIFKNGNYDKVIKIDDIPSFDKSRVLFKTHLRLNKPADMTKGEFADFLTKCLYENYPPLKYYQDLTNSINEAEYKDFPDLRIKFEPHFTWAKSGKSVTGIGIRATNKLVNIKKTDRPKILKAYGFDKEKDIKSSVPRLTLSLNRGEWFADEIDLYKEMHGYCEPDIEFNDDEREAIKALFMRAYFDNSAKNVAYHTWNIMNQDNISEHDVKDKMKGLRNAIEKVCGGKTYGNYIFFVESCVYLGALGYLLALGHKVWLLYDCFYCSGPEAVDEKMFLRVVNMSVRMGFNEFINFEKKVEPIDIEELKKL